MVRVIHKKLIKMLLIVTTIYTTLISLLLIRRFKIISRIDHIPIIDNIKGNAPMVSIIIPMRNEERNVRFSIESFISQNYPNFEVIAVNDNSVDNTLNILKKLESDSSRLKVVDSLPTPEGWVGKTHALWQGVNNSKGDWLLFADGDINADHRTLASVISYVQENNLDMLSLHPFHILETFGERVIQSMILTSIYFYYPQKKVNDPRSSIAAAIGGFILIKRSAYEATGGHMTLKDNVVEDVGLARLVKSSGYRLNIMGGEKLVRVRWYKNFNEMWEGWTKNVFFALRRDIGRLVFGAVALLAWGVIPVIFFLWSLLHLIFGKGITTSDFVIFIESVLLMIFVLLNSVETTRIFSIPRYYALTFPIGALGYIAIMLTSAYKVLSGAGVAWKDRVYKV